MKSTKDFENLSKTNFIEAVINLVWSAKRSMPAHFTTNGKRTQSFCVNFDGIDTKDEYQMASVAFYEMGDYIQPKHKLTQEQIASILRCSEDLMITSYIVHKLNKMEYINDVVAGLIQINQKSWPESFEVSKTFEKSFVKKWFKYCEKYGIEITNKSLNINNIEYI
jgi:hypothetical protein